MKTMKKFLMVLLGAALVLSMAGGVAAIDEKSESAVITAKITESYEIVVPSDAETVTLGYTNVQATDVAVITTAVEVKNVLVNSTDAVYAYLVMPSDGAGVKFTHKDTTNYAVSTDVFHAAGSDANTALTAMQTGTAIEKTSGDKLLFSVNAAATDAAALASGSEYLGLQLKEAPKLAGEYTGTLSFKFTIEAKPATE